MFSRCSLSKREGLTAAVNHYKIKQSSVVSLDLARGSLQGSCIEALYFSLKKNVLADVTSKKNLARSTQYKARSASIKKIRLPPCSTNNLIAIK